MGDVTFTIVRVLLMIAIIAGAYQRYRRLRADGTWSRRTAVYSLLLALAYVIAGVAFVVGTARLLPARDAWLIVPIAAVYLVGSTVVLAKLSRRIQRRP